jgi:endonuclease V-like protein UPF0215 family
MPPKRYSNIIGFDDGPFAFDHVGNVPIVGAIFTGLQLTGVIIGQVEKDGADAAEQIVELVAGSKFFEHLQLVMLQGITLAGFNVVDVFNLYENLGLPVLVVSRRAPDMAAIREALLAKIPQGEQRWQVVERLGLMEPVGQVFVQRVGLTSEEAAAVVERFAIYGHLPEPLRIAHLIAGAVAEGQSRGRA